MNHVRAFVAAACLAFASTGAGCGSNDGTPITAQPIAGVTGGTAGVTGGAAGMTGGAAGMTGGTAGMTGGTAGVTGGTAGVTGGTAGVTGGTAGVTGGTAGMTGGAAGMTGGAAGMTGGVGGMAGAAGAGGIGGQADAIPCEVNAVVMQACYGCHDTVPFFGAPMALTTLADFQRDYAVVSTKQLVGQSFKMYELARIRINREMGTSPMPQGPPLAAEKKAILNTWLMNGAPGGTACAPP